MDPFTMALLASTAISAGTSIYGGQQAADASGDAARLNDIRQKQAIGGIKGAVSNYYPKVENAVSGYEGQIPEYLKNIMGISGGFSPYQSAGTDALAQVRALLGLGGDTQGAQNTFRNTPGYQFAQQEGANAIDRSAASRGMLNSGRTLKEQSRFSSGLADQTYGNYLQQLMGLAGQGLNATGTGAAMNAGAQGNALGAYGAGAGLRTSSYGTGLNALTSAYGDIFGSDSPIAQGQIAGASAQQQGLQGAGNSALYGVGLWGGQRKPTINPADTMGWQTQTNFG